MNGRLRVHRVNEGNVINAGAEMGEQVADPLARLAILLELPLGPNDATFVLVPATAKSLDRDRLAIQRIKMGLVVKRIDLARPAIHEQEDDRLGLRRDHRLLGRERIDELRCLIIGVQLVEEAIAGEQASEGEAAKATAHFPQGFTTGTVAELGHDGSQLDPEFEGKTGHTLKIMTITCGQSDIL